MKITTRRTKVNEIPKKALGKDIEVKIDKKLTKQVIDAKYLIKIVDWNVKEIKEMK